MYYKITDKKSEAYQRINGFTKKIVTIRKENARKLEAFTKVAFKQFYSQTSMFSFCGKIEAIKPTSADFLPGKSWVPLMEDGVVGFFAPNRKTIVGKDINRFIKDLPDLTVFDLQKAFKWKTEKFSTPGIDHRGAGIVIEFCEHDPKYKPLPGMIEITASEFAKLKESRDKVKKKK